MQKPAYKDLESVKWLKQFRQVTDDHLTISLHTDISSFVSWCYFVL